VLAFAIGLALGFLSSVPALGPLALAIAAAALNDQRKRAVLLAVSGALAECLWASFAVVGIGQIVLAHPQALNLVRVVGAVVIVAFGISLFRSAGRDATLGRAGRVAGKSDFAFGFVVVGANPAFLLTWTGFATLLVNAQGLPLLPAWAVVAGAFVGIVTWFAALFALVLRFRRLLSARWLERAIRVIGVLVIGLGAALAITALRAGNQP